MADQETPAQMFGSECCCNVHRDDGRRVCPLHAPTAEQAPDGSARSPLPYQCKRCGWTGIVNGRQRCLACNRRRTEEWRISNPGKVRDKKRRYATRKGPEWRAMRHRRARANNPGTCRAAWRRRADWLAAGDVTAEQLKDIYFTANGRCRYCGTIVDSPRFRPSDPRGFDHVVARANGGLHTASNIVVACGNCNSKKAASEAVLSSLER